MPYRQVANVWPWMRYLKVWRKITGQFFYDKALANSRLLYQGTIVLFFRSLHVTCRLDKNAINQLDNPTGKIKSSGKQKKQAVFFRKISRFQRP
jgi:hypothetical protein